MLGDFLIVILWLILTLLHGLLSAIPISLPPQIGASIYYFAGYVRYLGGIIDIPGVFAAFGFLLNFLVAWFTFKAIMWIYHIIMARKTPDNQALPAQQKV